MKNKYPLIVCVLLAGFLYPLQAQVSAFELSGTVKTVSKNDDREVELPRGEVEIEEKSKILEIKLRRTSPTVSGNVTVKYAVLIKDMRGRLRPVVKGEEKISVNVGIPATLESDAFVIKEADFDLRNGGGNRMEQEVEGYVILLFNEEGEEVGAKFQPGSIEEKAREALNDEGSQGPRRR